MIYENHIRFGFRARQTALYIYNRKVLPKGNNKSEVDLSKVVHIYSVERGWIGAFHIMKIVQSLIAELASFAPLQPIIVSNKETPLDLITYSYTPEAGRS
jgi:hypothetical protein